MSLREIIEYIYSNQKRIMIIFTIILLLIIIILLLLNKPPKPSPTPTTSSSAASAMSMTDMSNSVVTQTPSSTIFISEFITPTPTAAPKNDIASNLVINEQYKMYPLKLSVSGSRNGSVLCICNPYSSQEPIHYSLDTGLTWKAIENTRNKGNWVSVACGMNNTIFSCIKNERIYNSSDLGENWQQTGIEAEWSGVCCSEDGSIAYACATNNRIYKYTNSSGWNETSSGIKKWSGLCCNEDGSKIFAFVHGGKVYVSHDEGLNWVEKLSDNNWNYISCNSSGSKVVVCGWELPLQISLDSGISWEEKDTTRKWLACGICDNILVGVGYNMEMVYSRDDGNQMEFKHNLGTRQSVFISQSGEIFVGSNYSGILYRDKNGLISEIIPYKYDCNIYFSDGNYQPRLTFTKMCYFQEDNTGSVVIACDSSNYSPLYISKNGGSDWSTFQENKTWSCVDMSRDMICAGNSGSMIYQTVDGENWKPRLIEKNWKYIRSSRDGKKIFCIPDFGVFFISNSSGQLWATKDFGWEEWTGLCCTSNGNQVYLCTSSGKIYRSINSGLSWNMVYNNLEEKWKGIDCTDDGQKIYAVSDCGNCYISEDYGKLWKKISEKCIDDNKNLRDINNLCCNQDGSILYISIKNDFIYQSLNGGLTWKKMSSQKKWYDGSIHKLTGKYIVAAPGYLCMIDEKFNVSEFQINNICGGNL